MSLDAGCDPSNRAIFLAVLDIADQRQRQAFLEDACVGDAERRREIERLLAAHHAGDASPVDQAIEQLSAYPQGPSLQPSRPQSRGRGDR